MMINKKEDQLLSLKLGTDNIVVNFTINNKIIKTHAATRTWISILIFHTF